MQFETSKTKKSQVKDRGARDDIDQLRRVTQPKSTPIEKDMPSNRDGFDGEVRFIKKSDGTYDRLDKHPDGWKRISGTLAGVEVKVTEGVPEIQYDYKGEKYRIKLEKVS